MIGRHQKDGALILKYTKRWKDAESVVRINYDDIIDFEITGKVETTFHKGDIKKIEGEWKGTRMAAGLLLAGPVGAALMGKTKDQYVGREFHTTEEDKRTIEIRINPNIIHENLYTGAIGVSMSGNKIKLPYSFIEIIKSLYPEKQKREGNATYEIL